MTDQTPLDEKEILKGASPARTAKALNATLKALEDTCSTWNAQWKELRDYLAPERGRFYTQGDQINRGDQYDASAIVDNVGGKAVETLAAGMQSGLTSPARPWFRLGLKDDVLEKLPEVKSWLHDVEKLLYAAFASSNFYAEAHSVYFEQAAFGTGCQLVEDDDQEDLRFLTLTIGEYAVSMDANGRPIQVGRRFYLTLEQLNDHFGRDNLSPTLQAEVDKPEPAWQTFYQVGHLVRKNSKYDPNKADIFSMRYESIYWEIGAPETQPPLRQSGYLEFPFMVPRWLIIGGNVYGHGPGHTNLPDVKMLQEMTADWLLAVHKTIDPPMRVPSNYNGTLDMLPGGLNQIDVNDPAGVGALLDLRVDLNGIQLALQEKKNDIRKGFFNDLFLMLQDAPNDMTATEVLERQSEKLLQLGPVLERQQNDFHDPLIDRVFGILYRRGKLPVPPPEIQGAELRVEYISLLALAQLRESLLAIQRATAYIKDVAQIAPTVLDKFNGDEAVDELQQVLGISPAIIRTDEEVKKIRVARAQKQALIEQQAQTAQTAATAKTLSQTDLSGGNALAEMMGAQNPVQGAAHA